ncbi:MAG: AmmeMemoRadiSam system protein B [Treponema sp.]|nr:AmmeMemoRadiSam system protein B [Treponema sp.]
MNLRKSILPAGWYPQTPDEINRFLSPYHNGTTPDTDKKAALHLRGARSAIAPHAGWFYSGNIAARAVASLNKKCETITVIGGHLPAGYPPLFAMEDAVSTPLGAISIDGELRAIVQKEIGGREDLYQDNTVEVLLPMVRYFFPDALLLWLRLPAELCAYEAGKTLVAAARKLGRSVSVLASTDLTHYGSNYNFAPKGSGGDALRWMRDVNDGNFIKAVESGDPAAVIERAANDHSSCSAGAVAGAMGFASAMNIGSAHLLEYGTSADAAEGIPDSFVGYAAFGFF